MAKLTKRSIDAAQFDPDGGGWQWLADDEVAGFGVRVWPSGTKSFVVRYRTRGARRDRYLTLGKYGVLTLQEARERARKELVRVLEGEDPLEDRRRQESEVVTVEDLSLRWLRDYAKIHRRRWAEDQGRIERHVLPKLGSVHLEEVASRLPAWHREIGRKAPVEANRALQTLRSAWRWAEGEGILPAGLTDPTVRVRKFKEKSRDRWLRKEELHRLLKVTGAEEDPFIRAAIPLLLLTGLRKRELLTARWSNVDLERGEIRLPRTKSGEPQTRLLAAPAVDLLRDLPRTDGSPWVFPSPTNPRKFRTDIKRPWERIREEAGIPDVTLHDLRRTAGSYMAQAGVPLQVIQQVLGHSHPGVTKLYARLASENEREALEALGRSIQSMMDDANDDGSPPRSHLRVVGVA